MIEILFLTKYINVKPTCLENQSMNFRYTILSISIVDRVRFLSLPLVISLNSLYEIKSLMPQAKKIFFMINYKSFMYELASQIDQLVLSSSTHTCVLVVSQYEQG